MKYLILGSSGFIGSAIMTELLRRNAEVICPDRNEIDLSNDKAYEKISCLIDNETHVIFCAGIKRQVSDNFNTFLKNEKITSNLCRAISERPPCHLLYLSSAAVYGEEGALEDVIDENSRLIPSSYYSISKINAEYILSKVGLDLSIPTCFARPPLVYGAGDLSLGYGPTGFCQKAVRGERIVLWGDGEELREFIWIEDLARICVGLSQRKICGGINTVSGKSYSFVQVLDILREISEKPIFVEFKLRTKQKTDVRFSSDQLQSSIGPFFFTPLREGVSALYKEFLNRVEYVDEV